MFNEAAQNQSENNTFAQQLPNPVSKTNSPPSAKMQNAVNFNTSRQPEDQRCISLGPYGNCVSVKARGNNIAIRCKHHDCPFALSVPYNEVNMISLRMQAVM